ncbi:MAG TPA: glycosyltransferase [Gaiellaceae bacterium]|nr:glycosyltransferase [Gaiellaceae bacterium]
MLRALVSGVTDVCIAYLVLVYAGYAFLVIFAALDNAIRNREANAENFDALESSRFTIPVSLLVPMFNEADVLGHVLPSLRGLRYPELEIIIVDDGSTDDTLARLQEELELEPVVRFERRVVETEPVRGTYRSRVDPRILVVSKENGGGKADANNCALNYARYRYVCCLDGDTIYMPDALLNTMRLVVRDPKRIVGATGHIAVATRPEQLAAPPPGRAQIENGWISNFQHMEYLRAFLNNRLAWSRFNFMLCSSGAFAIWRRDVLEEVGGFSRDFSCEDIEMTFRVHDHMRRLGRDYRIISLPEIVARTEGPATLRGLIAQRERWQRVTLETMGHYRRALGRPRYGAFGLVGMPFFLLSEALAPAVEVTAFASLAAGVALHLFDWRLYLVYLATMAFANAVLTVGAVLMEDISTRAYRLSHLARLIALSPLEVVLYRPVLVVARLRAVRSWLGGDRSWGKLERNVRAVTST